MEALNWFRVHCDNDAYKMVQSGLSYGIDTN